MTIICIASLYYIVLRSIFVLLVVTLLSERNN